MALSLSRLALLAGASLALAACGEGAEASSSLSEADKVISPDRAAVDYYVRPNMLARARTGSEPVPVVVLIEKDPWASVIGADSPQLALYDDGLLIYRADDQFRQERLDAAAQAELLDLVAKIDGPRDAGAYELSLSTDQTDTVLLLYRDEPVVVSAYGSLEDPVQVALLPEQLRAAFAGLHAYSRPHAEPWLPEFIEVMIWPYDYAPEASIHWPDDWPGLDDERTAARGSSYSLFLPSARLEELRAFLQTRNARGAVELGGKKWAMSYRYPFPMEQLWMPYNPDEERAAAR